MSALRGNRGLYATAQIGAEPAQELDDDLKNVQITSEDKDESDLTFREAAEGDVKDFTLVLTGVQDTSDGSLWRLLWDNPGATLEFVYGPSGNAVASETEPHFQMTVKNAGKPQIGGAAARSKTRYEFEHELEVLDGPHLVEA